MRWTALLLASCLHASAWCAQPVRVAMAEWGTLNPLLLSGDADSEAVDLLFDRLVTMDEKGRFIPELLESWDIREGGKLVILRLRPGLTWHDGRPIEAEDVVFTWRSLRLPRVRKVADTVSGVADLDSLTAEGPLTVRIRLARPRGSLLSDLFNFIPVPRHRYQVGAHPATDAINFAPVGSGPYRLAGPATKQAIRLQRWEGYRGIHPGRSEAFELLLQDPGGAILPALESETYHYSETLSAHRLQFYLVRKGVRGKGLLQTFFAPNHGFNAAFLNCSPARSLLGDRALRQALAELVPWQEFARAQRFLPYPSHTSFWIPESLTDHPTPRPLPQPARAEAILEAAGWRRGPDGIRRDAAGRRLALVAYEANGVRNARSEARLMSTLARAAGIEIEVRSVPWEQLMPLATKGQGDMWFYGWILSTDPDVDSPLFTRAGLQTRANVSAYVNPEVDRLFERGRFTLDPEARKQIYLEISEILYRDRPFIPFHRRQTMVIAHRRLKGVAFGSLGQSYGFWPGRRAWRLED